MRRSAVNKVVGCFAAMGANPDQLLTERTRLLQDDVYLYEWLSTIEQPTLKDRILYFLKKPAEYFLNATS